MTRGRKKDLSIPPSRALTQQRDYRARKAQYVTELEERCKRAEEENVRLKKELESARTGLPSPPSTCSSETAIASAELIQQLSATSASLSRFQQLAFTNLTVQLPNSSPPTSLPVLLPSASNSFPPPSFPSPAPTTQSRPNQSTAFSQSCSIRLPPIESFAGSPPLLSWQRTQPSRSSPSHSLSPSPSLESESESECCSGYVDCTDLTEEDMGREAELKTQRQIRTSEMRDPSDGSTGSSDRTLN